MAEAPSRPRRRALWAALAFATALGVGVALWAALPASELVSFILFLIPGFPKDYLSYLLGFSPMPLGAFVLISTVGRMPGTWLLSATGAGLVNQSRTALRILLILMGTIVVIGFLFRGKILQALRHASGH